MLVFFLFIVGIVTVASWASVALTIAVLDLLVGPARTASDADELEARFGEDQLPKS